MRPVRPARLPRALAIVLAALTLAGPGGRAFASSVYLPGLAFRVLVTPHFRIYFHQGEDRQARRLAGIAESVREELQARTRLAAPAVTHVVLASQDDNPNGSATPFPYPTVRLAAAWPATSDLIGNTDDWLRLVFIHEYTHILQLEQARGWARVARALLGRSPLSFPNLFLPQWQIEGYATWWESRLTGRGRLHGGDASAIVRERSGARTLPLDRANGGVVQWPGGNIQYLEGAWFFDSLVAQFGEEALGTLNRSTAGRIPYLSAPAFRSTFDRSVSDLWRSFQQDLASKRAADVAGTHPAGVARRTRDGSWVGAVRFDEAGARIFYSLRDPDGFPSIRVVNVSGAPAGPGATSLVRNRFGGQALSVRLGVMAFDEVELRENAALRSDLHLMDLGTGRSWRATRDARALEPDLSPDGRRLACVRVGDDGTRALAVYEVEREARGEVRLRPAPTSIPPEGATFGAPRWSPDGSQLAAERRLAGGPSQVVVVDVGSGRATVVVESPRGRVMGPAWMPGGDRVVFASDDDGLFQLHEVTLASGAVRQLTFLPGGATSPDVSPDGRMVAFASVGPEGYDVYTMALSGGSEDPPSAGGGTGDGTGGSTDPPATSTPDPTVAVKRYSPLPTLLPRTWTPLSGSKDGQLQLGVGVAGQDVLARHAWAASALWRLGADNGSGAPAGRPDWTASYVYDRWRPAFIVSASDKTSLLTLPRLGRAPLPAALREQDLTAGISVPFQQIRFSQVWQGAFNAGTDTLSSGAASERHRRPALRAAWAFNSGKQYGWSISTEDGVAAALTSEQVRSVLGADGDADAFTAEVRAYWRPGRAHAVLAARGGFGTAAGNEAVRRRFTLGGSTQASSLIDFGSDVFRLLRGFDVVARGRRIGVASLEWRQPLLRVERGWGVVPLLLRTVHGAVFVDAGQAWDAGFSLRDVKSSVGVEASADVVAGFVIPLTLTVGTAWTRDPTSNRSGVAGYVRIGPSF
jgi:hypothetical protein